MRALAPSVVLVAALAPAAPARAQVTVYSSLPLQGASADQTQAAVRGEQLALEQMGGTAAGQPVTFVSLDDSTAKAGNWDPQRCAANARRAAQDKAAAFYVGDFNSGCSAITMPILNGVGVPQISPSNTYVGLTRSEGARPGEPAKYHPSGARSYVRVIGADHLQAAAIVAELRARGLSKAFLVTDLDTYGRSLGALVAARAKAAGVRLVGRRPTGGRDAAAVARAVARSGAQAAVYVGVTVNRAPRVVNAIVARKAMPVLGADGVTESGFTRSLDGKARARFTGFVSGGGAQAFGGAADAVAAAYTAKYGEAPDPFALQGYEAMALGLDAANRAGSTDGEAVAAQLFATRDRASILGTYSIDANGDPDRAVFSVYRATPGGSLAYDHALSVGP